MVFVLISAEVKVRVPGVRGECVGLGALEELAGADTGFYFTTVDSDLLTLVLHPCPRESGRGQRWFHAAVSPLEMVPS